MSITTKRFLILAVICVVSAVLATLCHLSKVMAWQMLGSFFGLVALVPLVSFLAHTYPFMRGVVVRKNGQPPLSLKRVASRVIPALVVIVTAVAVLAPLLTGQMPLSHDHPVHLYKAWHFWEEMLLQGRLRGWSSYWFFGYPAEELYPIGPDIWVAAVRLVTLGLFSWEATYGLAFVGVFALAAYAVYSFGRRHFSAGAGVVAAMMWIFDRGDYREGGWSYTVEWAVWVQIMAMAFALLALGRLKLVLERGRARDYAICGLLVAAALLSHQMNVIVFGLAVPLLLLARWLADGRPFGRELTATMGVMAIGVAIAAFWMLPMMSRSGWTMSIGDLWRPLSHSSKGLLDGSLFANVWPLYVMLGLVGVALGLAMRRPVPIFLALLAAVLIFAASSTAFHELSLMSISKAFSKIQYQRFMIPVKACIYLLAGFTVSELWRRVLAFRIERAEQERELAQLPTEEHPAAPPAETGQESEADADREAAEATHRPTEDEATDEPANEPANDASTPGAGHAPPTRPGAAAPALTPWRVLARRAGLVALVCVVLAPLVRPTMEQLWRNYLRTVGSLMLKKSVHYWGDYKRFLQWSAQKRAQSSKFYRIAYELDRHNHLMMGAPAYNNTPYYKVGYTPAKLFKHVTETTEDEVYRALSVAYVVSMRRLTRPSLQLETSFGPIQVYRFKDYRPERYTLTGPGTVEVKEFSEERIHLKLRGTSAASRLKVHVSNYPRWRARLNGEELPIAEAPVYGTTYPMLMEVPARDGDLVFEYVVRAPDAAGALLTLLGLGAVALLLWGRREGLRTWFAVKLGWVGRLGQRYAAWAALVGVLLVAGLVIVRLARGSNGLGEGSFAALLPQAKVTQAGRPCTDYRQGKWFCTARSWNYVGPTTNMFNGAFLPCIWAHPVGEGPITITFPKVTLGHALVGDHGLGDAAVTGFANGAPVTMGVEINGQKVQELVRPNQKGWVGFRIDTTRFAGKTAQVKLTVSTTRPGGRHYCFDMRVER